MKNIKKNLMAFACLLTVAASSMFAGCDFESILSGILPSGSSSQTQQSSKDENKNSSTTEKPDDSGNTGGDDNNDGNQGESSNPEGGNGQKPDDGGNVGGDTPVNPNPPVNPDTPVNPDGSYTLTYTDNGEGYTVTGKGTFAGGALEIPQTHNGKPVTMIGESAFYGCTNLYSLTLPSGITSIAMGAFGGCINLTSVKLGEGLVDQCYLDPSAFSDCYKIAEIYEPMGMLYMGDETMFGGIAKNALNVYSMYMGSSGLSTDENGFVIYEPQPDPMMPEMPVSGDKVLVNYVGTKKDVTLPSVHTVGKYAFYGNNYVETVTIPEGVKMLKDYAFSGNVLKKVKVPASVTSLAGAFRGELSEVEISTDNKLYKSIDGNVYSKNGEELWSYMPGKTDALFTVPAHVKKIHVAAFWGANHLVGLTINENVKDIGEVGFKNCKSLKTLKIKGENTKIGLGAFEYVRSLETVEITGSVEIGRLAFQNCSSLVNLTLGEGVTLAANNIGYSNAFSGCTALKEVRIPGSIKTLYVETFAGCSLDLLVLEEGVETVGKDAFDYMKKIKTVVLPSTIKSLGFSYNNKIETIYYKGTPEQRANIKVSVVGDVVPLAKNWYFYSETTPTDTEHQYWYYDSEGKIALY